MHSDTQPTWQDLLSAPHRADGRFFNPWGQPSRGLRDLLRWKLGHNPYDKRRAPCVPVVPNDGAYLADPGAQDSITWVGHATFAVQDGGEVFLTDPHWGARALLPRRHAPPGIPLAAVPAQAFAVLSHNHYDHLDAWTVARLPPGVDWYAPLGLAGWLRRRRARSAAAPVRELDWWQTIRRGRWTLTCLPAQHWSNRLDSRRNSTLWCSWLLDSGRRRYYFAGDSGYFPGFAEIGRRCAPIDVAFLPIGAYEPRWFMAYPHMDPADAWRACLDLGARWMVPMHWGTFDLTDEPIDLPPKVLFETIAGGAGSAEGAGTTDRARVRLLAVGERWLPGGDSPGEAGRDISCPASPAEPRTET
jgi:N-acyl-phosphatidylethanolamine-hydrolysing phospholipase D